MCIECFCSRRLAHVEEALFTAYDQAALSGQHVLPGRAVSPPSSGGAGREDSPWVDAVTLPGREEMQAGQVAVLASSPTSQTDSSVLNLVGSMVTSVFSSPTYVGKSVYSGLSECLAQRMQHIPDLFHRLPSVHRLLPLAPRDHPPLWLQKLQSFSIIIRHHPSASFRVIAPTRNLSRT